MLIHFVDGSCGDNLKNVLKPENITHMEGMFIYFNLDLKLNQIYLDTDCIKNKIKIKTI